MHQWRPSRSWLKRQHEPRRRRIRRRKALRAWKAAALARRSWKGSLALPRRVGSRAGSRRQRDRERQRPVLAACERPNRLSAGHARFEKGRVAQVGREGGRSRLVSAAATASPLEVGDAACGYPAPS
jgi:hypothetical protein